MIPLLYLASRQSMGGLKYRLGRLKNPRYFVPALLAILYFWMSFGFPGLMDSGRDTAPRELAPLLRLFIGPGMALMFGVVWLFSPAKPAPAFSRAEAAQLFMLPISRRHLIVYRLLRPQLSFLLIAGFAALGATRSADINPGYAAGGAWVFINLIALNAMAASLGCNRMRRRGVPRVAMGWPGILIVVYVVAPVAMNWRPLEIGSEPPIPWLRERMTGGAAEVLHWPLRHLGNVVGAGDFATFGTGLAWAVVAGLLLFALCMVLVAPFEEESLKIAEAGGRKLDAMKRGGAAGASAGRLRKVRSTRVPLRPTGPTWRAVFWQTLVSEWRVGAWKIAYFFALVLPVVAVFSRNEGLNVMLVGMCGAFAAMLALMSPRMLVTGLHTELRFLPVMKALPLPGYDLLRGKVRAGALLACVPIFLLGLGAVIAAANMASPDEIPRVAGVFVSCLPLAPAVVMLMIALESAAVLMFPAWMTSMQSEPGFEMIGRNLMSLLVRVVVGSLMAIPPGLLFAAGFGVGIATGQWVLGLAGGALLAALALLAETEVLMYVMGRRFDTMDASPESA